MNDDEHDDENEDACDPRDDEDEARLNAEGKWLPMTTLSIFHMGGGGDNVLGIVQKYTSHWIITWCHNVLSTLGIITM